MKKDIIISVTGAGGFLGSAAIHTFLSRASFKEVRALYGQPPESTSSDPRFKPFIGRLNNQKLAREFLSGVDLVLHLAHFGFVNDPNDKPMETVKENLQITANLLENMRMHNVKRILYTSSGDALYRFDPLKRVPFHENSEIEFRSSYALSKATIEQLLQYYKQTAGFSPVVLRLSEPYGAGQFERPNPGFISSLFASILSGDELKIYGALDICRDFIFIEDLVRAIEGFIQDTDHTGIYNLSSGIGVTLREIITSAERITSKKVITKIVPPNPMDPKWTILNNSKLQRTINWTCHHSLQDGMRVMWKEIIERLHDSSQSRKAA